MQTKANPWARQPYIKLAQKLTNHSKTFTFYRYIEKRKARSGRKVPDGPGRFDPTSEEWKAILDRPAAPEPKKKKPEPKKKKPAAKENKKKKTAVNQIKSMLIQ